MSTSGALQLRCRVAVGKKHRGSVEGEGGRECWDDGQEYDRQDAILAGGEARGLWQSAGTGFSRDEVEKER